MFKYSSAIKLNGVWTKQLGPRDSLPLLGISIDELRKKNKQGWQQTTLNMNQGKLEGKNRCGRLDQNVSYKCTKCSENKSPKRKILILIYMLLTNQPLQFSPVLTFNLCGKKLNNQLLSVSLESLYFNLGNWVNILLIEA